MNTPLAGRRHLVTGGSAGIGAAIARSLVEAGARVAIAARGEKRLRETAAAIGAEAIVADVASEDACIRLVREAEERLGGLDGLINNAGIGAFGPVEELDVEAFRRVLDVNVLAPAILMREAVPAFERAGRGDVVNVSSTSGLKGDAGGTIYCASKFALKAMSQCWQAELRKRNVRVILVNPSEVQTGFGGRRRDGIDPAKLVAEDIAAAVLGALTMHPRGFIPEMTVFATNPWGA